MKVVIEVTCDEDINKARILLDALEERKTNESKKIVDIELSTRCFICLRNLGIETLRDLINTPRKKVAMCKNLGRKTMNEIEYILAMNGLQWKNIEE